MKRLLLSFLAVSVLLLSACTSPAVTQTVTVTTTTTPATPTVTVTSTTTSIVTDTSTATQTVITTPPTTTTPTTTPPTTTTPITTPTTIPPTTTAVDLSNVALVGTGNGFNIVDESGISVFNGELGGIRDAAIDEQGQVWAVYSGGLSVFDGQGWIDYQRPEGVYTLEAIATDSAGRVWIGYYGGG